MADGDDELEDLDAAWGAALNEQKGTDGEDEDLARSEEHTSELQSH